MTDTVRAELKAWTSSSEAAEGQQELSPTRLKGSAGGCQTRQQRHCIGTCAAKRQDLCLSQAEERPKAAVPGHRELCGNARHTTESHAASQADRAMLSHWPRTPRLPGWGRCCRCLPLQWGSPARWTPAGRCAPALTHLLEMCVGRTWPNSRLEAMHILIGSRCVRPIGGMGVKRSSLQHKAGWHAAQHAQRKVSAPGE